MKRLVYAPKVWIFIRSSNILDEKGNPRIYDVSSDIVRGSVTQNLNDLSKARFELRNRFRKWIRSPADGSKQMFLPMDLVTIWMQRIAGRPIQVFTGYLDEVPYYQAYPANAVFTASCTLKKLAFNWFDPGLPIFQNWMIANGWAFDPTTGNVLARTKPDSDGKNVMTAGDQSFADLLGRFLVDIAGWAPNDIVISNMPPGIAEKASELYASVENQTDESLRQLGEMMGKLLGVTGAVGVDNNIDSKVDDDETSKAIKKVLPASSLTEVKKVTAAATTNGLPPWLLVFAGLLVTEFKPGYKQDNRDDPNWGYGLYAMRPQEGVTRYPNQTLLIDGVGVERIMDPGIAASVFSKRLNRNRTDQADKALKGDAAAAAKWVEAALGRTVLHGGRTVDEIYQAALQASGTQKADGGGNEPKPMLAVDVKNTPLTHELVTARVTPDEAQVIQARYKDAPPELGAILLRVKSIAPAVKIIYRGTDNPLDMFLEGTENDLMRLWQYFKGKPEYQRVEMNTAGASVALDNGVKSALPLVLGGKPQMLVKVNIPLFDKLGTISLNDPLNAGVTQDAMGEQGGITFKQMAAFSANAAFASNFAFPGDRISSMTLVGDKALMNDISCIKGVQQLCAASLRCFRSLPDGRFMAFYPDYFGAYRDPYWKIHNIEIVDFGIQLNDEALATHVYVIGDSFPGGEMEDLWQQAASRGVATITQALMLDSFITPLNMTNSNLTGPENSQNAPQSEEETRLGNAFNFLEHYGARPHKEDQPLIKNPFYEFLLAWQRFMSLWAQQFATTAEFTFQPEVMAGGLIEFAEPHNVQMFCDSVTHNFDYQGGFTTDAVLTAPSLTKGKRGAKNAYPGFALGGSINTVGVTA